MMKKMVALGIEFFSNEIYAFQAYKTKIKILLNILRLCGR